MSGVTVKQATVYIQHRAADVNEPQTITSSRHHQLLGDRPQVQLLCKHSERFYIYTRAFCTSSGCFYSITPASAYCLAGLAVVACIPVRSSISSMMLAPGADTVPVFSTARRIEPCSHQAYDDTAIIDTYWAACG